MNTKWSLLNVFQYCKFLRLLGHVMVLLVLGIVAFTYYTVVALQYGPGIVGGGFLQALGCTLVVVIFSALVGAAGDVHPAPGCDAAAGRGTRATRCLCSQVFMLLWAYFAAVTTDPGRVPAGWHPFQDEQVRGAHGAVLPDAGSRPPSAHAGPSNGSLELVGFAGANCSSRHGHRRDN